MIEGTRQLVEEWWATYGEYEGWLTIRLHPPGDVFSEAPGLAEAVWNEISHSGSLRVALEMQDVSFLPSSLMGVVIRLHKRIAVAGGTLLMVGLSAECRDAWHACRLDTVLPVHDTLQEAVAT